MTQTVVGAAAAYPRISILSSLPGMRPHAPRRNFLVALLYLLLAALAVLLIWSNPIFP